MHRFIFKKTLTSIITFFVVAILLFFLINAFKINPIPRDGQVDDSWNELVKTYGLDKPLIERFVTYVKGIFNNDWGLVYSDPTLLVTNEFFNSLTRTMLIAIPGYFIGMFFGVLLGYWAGYRKDKLDDLIIRNFVTLFVAVPMFIFAVYAMVLSPMLDWPISFIDFPDNFWSDTIFSISIPLSIVSLTSLSFWTMHTRLDVVSALSSESITSLRTRGFSEFKIFRSYVFKNILFGFIDNIFMIFIITVGSSVVMERMFGVPGIAQLLNDALHYGDINIVMFNALFFLMLGFGLEYLLSIVQYVFNPFARAASSSAISLGQKMKAKRIRVSSEIRSLKALKTSTAQGGGHD